MTAVADLHFNFMLWECSRNKKRRGGSWSGDVEVWELSALTNLLTGLHRYPNHRWEQLLPCNYALLVLLGREKKGFLFFVRIRERGTEFEASQQNLRMCEKINNNRAGQGVDYNCSI